MDLYGNKGFTVIGFPCPDFYNQEPGDNDEVLNILKYVRPGKGFVPKFPLMGIVDVNGQNTDPVYVWLKARCGTPTIVFTPQEYISWNPVQTNDLIWNFQKFLVDKRGKLYKRYDDSTVPLMLSQDIEYLLNQN